MTLERHSVVPRQVQRSCTESGPLQVRAPRPNDAFVIRVVQARAP